MITKALQHARENLVAYLALFIALGGTSYAAVNLPAGSVGGKQLRNHSISPIKFDPQFINGSVRAWVAVNADGRVQAGAGRPIVQLGSTTGAYFIRWRKVATPTQRGCFPISGVTNGFGPGFTKQVLNAASTRGHPGGVFVDTYDAQGQPFAESFYAALIC